jgi:hypothetical protein
VLVVDDVPVDDDIDESLPSFAIAMPALANRAKPISRAVFMRCVSFSYSIESSFIEPEPLVVPEPLVDPELPLVLLRELPVVPVVPDREPLLISIAENSERSRRPSELRSAVV